MWTICGQMLTSIPVRYPGIYRSTCTGVFWELSFETGSPVPYLVPGTVVEYGTKSWKWTRTRRWNSTGRGAHAAR